MDDEERHVASVSNLFIVYTKYIIYIYIYTYRHKAYRTYMKICWMGTQWLEFDTIWENVCCFFCVYNKNQYLSEKS